ncbi:MAG: hypothetical protein HQK96_01515 [Nitrospirae bacterium]|nr:hypothetical protein [Nitrospirota bacterium]
MMQDTIVQKHKKNFETLIKAFKDDSVCLLDCIENATGEHVAVICATNFDGKEVDMVPFAKFFNSDPYKLLVPSDVGERVKIPRSKK